MKLTVIDWCVYTGETLQVRVSWDEYRDKVVDYGMIKIYALASVAETKQTWSEEDDFQLEKPKLDVQVCRTMNSIQKNVIKKQPKPSAYYLLLFLLSSRLP